MRTEIKPDFNQNYLTVLGTDDGKGAYVSIHSKSAEYAFFSVYLDPQSGHDLIDALKGVFGDERPVPAPTFEKGDKVVVLANARADYSDAASVDQSAHAGRILTVASSSNSADLNVILADGPSRVLVSPWFLAKVAK